MAKIDILRKIDRILGVSAIAVQGALRKKAAPPKNPRRILIIKLFGFGNFIFLSPVFKLLKDTFPKAQIEVLTFRQNREICQMYPEYVDKIHTIDYSVRKMGFQMLSFAAKNFKKFDIAIDFEQFVRLSAIIGGLARPKYFLGIVTPNSKKQFAFDHAILYPEQNHVVEEYYHAAAWLVKKYKKKTLPKPLLLRPKTQETRRIKELLAVDPHCVPIGVCPGGRADDQERRYPKEKLADALASLVKKNRHARLFLFGTASERPDVEYLMSKLPKSRCVDVTGLSLPESAHAISKMKVFISNDTGPIHLAAALGVYCIGMYGPSKEWIYGPYTSKKTILRDEKHKPVRSNHNEKSMGWPKSWWPNPERVSSEIIHIINQQHKIK